MIASPSSASTRASIWVACSSSASAALTSSGAASSGASTAAAASAGASAGASSTGASGSSSGNDDRLPLRGVPALGRLVLDPLLQHHDALDERLGPGRTAGHVH